MSHNGDCGGNVSGPPPGTAGERLLVRGEDGLLMDSLACRTVSLAELADDVRCGRRFRAREGASGSECTYQVLVQILLATLAPGATAGALSAMTGLPSAVREGFPTGRTT
ncbi:hypothetical protein [Streptomyces sp. NPDC051662]|uniref:hypothetical protein n=1 Tax=Streptomyces sp. NPDC051662 TaxID=3154750 RepID=UPI003423AA40